MQDYICLHIKVRNNINKIVFVFSFATFALYVDFIIKYNKKIYLFLFAAQFLFVD